MSNGPEVAIKVQILGRRTGDDNYGLLEREFHMGAAGRGTLRSFQTRTAPAEMAANSAASNGT